MEAGRFAAGSGRAELPHRGNAMGFSRKLDPFSLPVRFTPPMKRPTSVCASSISIVSGSCCAVRCAACAWRSICRSRPSGASRYGWSLPTQKRRQPASRSYSNTAIRRCRCRCSRQTSATTSLPSGSPGAVCSDCRFWSRETDGTLREPFARVGAFRVRRRRGGAAGAAPSPGGGRACCCGGAQVRSRRHPSFIATSTRSSPETDRHFMDRKDRPDRRLAFARLPAWSCAHSEPAAARATTGDLAGSIGR